MRYFFHIYNDVVCHDDEGADLPDLDAAIAHAVSGARSLAAESVCEGHLTAHHRIEITDSDKTVLHTVRFDEAVNIRP